MFLYQKLHISKIKEILADSVYNVYSFLNLAGKAKLSPPNLNKNSHYCCVNNYCDAGTFFFAPLRGSLTVEAAVVVPLFLFAMIAALQFAAVMGTAVKFGTSLADTGKEIAAAAYISRYGGDVSEVPELAASALSAMYVHGKLERQAGDTSAVKNTNLLLSSFLDEDEMIDLVLTYQIRSPIQLIPLPENFFIQRARVRAWTGRTMDTGSDAENDDSRGTQVYVTEHGSVYHDDPDCSHLRLSVRTVTADQLDKLRNKSGEIYHRCEKCGVKDPSGTVYITTEGNRYHSSLECSGLKRTVRQVSKEEAGSMKACSKCGK